MSEKKILFPCIQLAKGDINPRVITCGDPERAEKIAALLDNSRCLKKNREYWTFAGTHKGIPVTVTSHGVGSGGAAIAFESLWRAGAKIIIRVGTCGGMQPGVRAGSMVIVTAACREEGVTEKMIPLSYPAVADTEVVNALSAAASQRGAAVHKGVVLTQALFYPSFLENNLTLYAKANVLAMENEVASLLVVASTHNVKAGAILTADAPAFGMVDVEDYQPDMEELAKAIQNQILIALDAIVAMDDNF
ncbi:MAG: nucleoside phosphorylase [Oscillospiraceae bacterium]